MVIFHCNVSFGGEIPCYLVVFANNKTYKHGQFFSRGRTQIMISDFVGLQRLMAYFAGVRSTEMVNPWESFNREMKIQAEEL